MSRSGNVDNDSLSGKNILVTGGTGFIGTNLVEKLLQTKSKVSVISNKPPSLPWAKPIFKNASFFPADISNEQAISKIIKEINPDVVFHLAATLNRNRTIEAVYENIKINLQGTMNVAKSLLDSSIESFVYTSTSDVYGNQTSVPYKETLKPEPSSPYAISKYSAETHLKFLHDVYKFPVVILRPFLAYGKYMFTKDLLVSSMIMNVLKGKDLELTEGKQTRDFIFVEDIAEAAIIAASTKQAQGKVLNIGTGKETSVREIVEKILSIFDYPVKAKFGAIPYRTNEIWRMFADNSETKKILGWEPQTSLNKGLAETISWIKESYTNHPALFNNL